MWPKHLPLPFPSWFYESLIINIRPRAVLVKRPPEPLAIQVQVPAEVSNYEGLHKLTKSKQHDFSAVMKELFEIVVTLLLDHRIEIQKVEVLLPLQKDLLQTYLQYILKPVVIEKVFGLTETTVQITYEDMLDLSRRRDETLKKVLSIALKIIYKEFLIKNKINQNLNPRKYVKRNEINRRIFKYYFEREPMMVSRRRCQTYEHNYLFYIKEGVTEEWFETVLGIRPNAVTAAVGEPRTRFLQKIYGVLNSEQLTAMYKRKIVSMVKKSFTLPPALYFHEEIYGSESLPASAYDLIKKRLEPAHKKPKTALSIDQFKRAIKLSLDTLDRFCSKYHIEYTDDLARFKTISKKLEGSNCSAPGNHTRSSIDSQQQLEMLAIDCFTSESEFSV